MGNGRKRIALCYVWFSFKLLAILFVVGATVKQPEDVCKKEKKIECLDRIFGSYVTGCGIEGTVTLNLFSPSASAGEREEPLLTE